MIFTSDNVVGASQKVLDAIIAANHGIAASYGNDAWTKRVEAQLDTLFGRAVTTFLVPNGTAANALACAAICPPWGALLTHRESHVMDDECGAPEFYMGGAKLVGLAGVGGKITPEAIHAHFAKEPGGTRRPPLKGLSIAQGTEFGLVYTPEEVAALKRACVEHGLRLHMDGARFWNALVTLNCTAGAITHEAGVDILSLGGTKNGALMAEAVVIFDPALAEDFRFKRKRAGQTLSKQRLIAAQYEALLTDAHWRDLARHANASAAKLAAGIAAIPGLRVAFPREINEVFLIVPEALAAHLLASGAQFCDWSDECLPPGEAVQEGETILRLVTSFATRDDEIEQFLALSRTFMAMKGAA
jgi:threonine aldolase